MGSKIEDRKDHRDQCHRNIVGAADYDLGDIITSVPLDRIFVCENGSHRPLTASDAAAFRSRGEGLPPV